MKTKGGYYFIDYIWAGKTSIRTMWKITFWDMKILLLTLLANLNLNIEIGRDGKVGWSMTFNSLKRG